MKNNSRSICGVLIIGAGNIGAFFDRPTSKHVLTHAHAFSILPNCKILGFVDINAKKGLKASLIWKTQYYKSIKDAFLKCEPDIVVIATPDETHGLILEAVSKYHPKAVLVEKPIVSSLEEAKRLVKIYSRKEIPLVVNYSRRFLPEFQNLRVRIQNNEFGSFIRGSGLYGKGILHNGSHMIDLLRYLIGEVKLVQVFDSIIDYNPLDPSCSSILRTKSGNMIVIQQIDNRLYTMFEIDLFFEKKRIRIVDAGRNFEEYDVITNLLYSSQKNLKITKVLDVHLNKSTQYSSDYVYKLANNGIESTLVSGEDAIKTLDICLQIKMKALL